MRNTVFVILVFISFLIIALFGELIWFVEKNKRNADLIQQEWDAFSFGMTEKEKREIVFKWSADKSMEHGWRDIYIPKL